MTSASDEGMAGRPVAAFGRSLSDWTSPVARSLRERWASEVPSARDTERISDTEGLRGLELAEGGLLPPFRVDKDHAAVCGGAVDHGCRWSFEDLDSINGVWIELIQKRPTRPGPGIGVTDADTVQKDKRLRQIGRAHV